MISVIARPESSRGGREANVTAEVVVRSKKGFQEIGLEDL